MLDVANEENVAEEEELRGEEREEESLLAYEDVHKRKHAVYRCVFMIIYKYNDLYIVMHTDEFIEIIYIHLSV
jgi:hypothetical protein